MAVSEEARQTEQASHKSNGEFEWKFPKCLSVTGLQRSRTRGFRLCDCLGWKESIDVHEKGFTLLKPINTAQEHVISPGKERKAHVPRDATFFPFVKGSSSTLDGGPILPFL
jgi:hypothetical protein